MKTRQIQTRIERDPNRPDPGPASIRAAFLPETVDVEKREVEIVWTTGAAVRRWRWEGWDVVEYDQELALDATSVRVEFLDSGRAPYLDNHDSRSNDSVLGVIVEGSVEVDAEAGEGRARVRFDETELAQKRFGSVQRGILRNVSVGFNIHQNERVAEAGSQQEVELWRATDWEPLEVSQVPIGADSGATVREARAYVARITQASEEDSNVKTDPNIETTPSEITPEKRAAIAAEGAKLENERQAGIRLSARALRFDSGSELVSELLADPTVELDAARAKLIDAAAKRDDESATSGARAGLTVGQEESEKRGGAVVRALMHRAFPDAKGANGEKLFAVESGTIESEFAHRSLLWIAEDCLRRGGVDTRFMSKSQIASAALSMRTERGAMHARAGMISTADFPLLLADVTNKSLRMGYEVTPRTFTTWCRRTTASNLHDIKRTQLSGGLALEEVEQGAEYTYGRTHEARETYALRKFGRIIAITEETLIQDDLDGFARVGQIYGAAAADLESDVVYGLLGNNSNMSDGNAIASAPHSNIATTEVGAPDVAAFGEGRLAMRRQTDLDEVRILNIMPRYVIAPAAHETTIDQVLSTIQANTAANAIPEFVRSLVPVIEPRLDDFSATAWWMAADPSRIDTVEYAYMDGEEGLQIATRAGWEVDGVEIKAKMRFAAQAIDFRGLFRNAGA